MSTFEVDLGAMRKAFGELEEARAKLLGYQRRAADLASRSHHLPDGTSPIAPQMRKAYVDRSDLDGGLQEVLTEYLGELTDIQNMIQATIDAYQAADARSAADAQQLANQTPGEAQ
jgi:hypothetical protein